MVFVDYILIYSKFKEEHERHLNLALQLLRSRQLYAKFSKSDIPRACDIEIKRVCGSFEDSSSSRLAKADQCDRVRSFLRIDWLLSEIHLELL